MEWNNIIWIIISKWVNSLNTNIKMDVMQCSNDKTKTFDIFMKLKTVITNSHYKYFY